VKQEAFVSPRYNSEKAMDSSSSARSAPSHHPEVSVIIPARNEEACIGECLASLTAQDGVAFEIIVVDDASTDLTREIAQSFAGVRVFSADYLSDISAAKKARTGKNNALIAGAEEARADWLLFTDADTIHLPGSLARSLAEAKRERADLLSYSPEQVAVTFSERAVLPVIFAELARQYPPDKVRDPNSGIVAANGQYILVRREAYEAVGGHVAVAAEILEDVALARLFHKAGRRVYFRYGGDAVCTRMYRNWHELREGWTKNLALLFPQPAQLAMESIFMWVVAWSALAISIFSVGGKHYFGLGLAFFWLWLYRRIGAAHFTTMNNLIAIAFGPPMFAYLLLRSKRAYANGQVFWKGRAYSVSAASGQACEQQAKKPLPPFKNQRVRTEN
jgi:glycosyltransferase involved in cell wall biosynthesis